MSNAVPVFRPPEARNAGQTLIIMAGLMAILFIGTIGLTQFMAVVPQTEETILSALAHTIFGNGILYFLTQVSTLLILAVAANTSFAGFPRLAAILARDGYLPHSLAGLGDRLVFSNGILALGGISGLLILLFNGNTHIYAHFQNVARQLSLSNVRSLLPRTVPRPRIVIPISGVHKGIINAVNLACRIGQDVTAVYVEIEPGSGEKIKQKWITLWPEIPLVILPSPYRSLVAPLLDFLDETDRKHHDGQLAVVMLPEIFPARWWHSFLHNQSAWLLKTALLYRRRHMGFQRVIIDVPYHLKN